jgi:hypothetical protein
MQTAEYAHIEPAFKHWVAELQTVLDSAQRFLDAEDRALTSEDLRTLAAATGARIHVIHERSAVCCPGGACRRNSASVR